MGVRVGRDEQAVLLQGSRWRATHRASVVAILGADAPPIYSRGSRFYNVDRWTGRLLVGFMCEWAKANPGCTPTRNQVTEWVDAANAKKPEEARHIVIAATPSLLTMRLALALTGGGYHEALHTQRSCRRDLVPDEIIDIVLPRWARVGDWSKLFKLLQDWSNYVEDVRIERVGNQDYPGIHLKMCHLQDFILEQEFNDRQQILAQGGVDPLERAAVVAQAVFRDVGLGYQTETQDEALARYREVNPEAVALVLEGPLRPMLDEAIALTAEDDLGCLRVAMDVIVALAEHLPEDEEVPAAKESSCPSCAAPATCLVARPLSDGRGHRVPGRCIITCTRCGWQQEADLAPSTRPPVEPVQAPPEPPCDAPTPPEGGQQGGLGTPMEPPQAGGHRWDPDAASPWVADEILKDTAEGGLRDAASAIAAALVQIRNHEDNQCAPDEKPWRPFDQTLDVVTEVPPSQITRTFDGKVLGGRDNDKARAAALLQSVRTECAYLRARLRSIVYAVEQRGVVHGVRRGQAISERTLVDSVVDLRGGRFPSRAYQVAGDKIDMSIAAVLMIDESESMGWGFRLPDATKCLLALTDALEAVGAHVLVAGFRDGPASKNWNASERGDEYHRFNGVCFDVFKSFQERLAPTQWRFANTRAVGGTPMADGVQFGVTCLQGRSEVHRVFFVITDGQPNHGHLPVMRHLIRRASQAGILVIGVGIGADSADVVKVFPDHVWAENIKAMPKHLVAKLNEVLDFRGLRPRRMAPQAKQAGVV